MRQSMRVSWTARSGSEPSRYGLISSPVGAGGCAVLAMAPRSLVRIAAPQRGALRFGIACASPDIGQEPAPSPVWTDKGGQRRAFLSGKAHDFTFATSEASASLGDVGFGLGLRSHLPDRGVGSVSCVADGAPFDFRRCVRRRPFWRSD